MASEITAKGASLYDLLGQEAELRVRHTSHHGPERRYLVYRHAHVVRDDCSLQTRFTRALNELRIYIYCAVYITPYIVCSIYHTIWTHCI